MNQPSASNPSAAASTSSPSSPSSPPPAAAEAGSLTIAALQRLIRERYYATDSARGTAATFMWFIEEVGELSTALARNGPGKSPTPAERANLDEEFADVLAWLCTLANINGVDLEKALEKYTVRGVEGVKS